MARLPTVTLQHRSARDAKGRPLIRTVNATDYARDISGYSAKWKIISTRDGEATVRQVQEAADASDLEKHRGTDPEEVRKRGDKKRAFEERTHRRNVVTKLPLENFAAAPGEKVVVTPPAEADAHQEKAAKDRAPLNPDWRTFPWFKRRQHIADVTGTTPTNAAHAEELAGERE